jgi:hypothetical protein
MIVRAKKDLHGDRLKAFRGALVGGAEGTAQPSLENRRRLYWRTDVVIL